MKKRIKDIYENFLDYIKLLKEVVESRLFKNDLVDSTYNSLSPTNKATNVEHYFKAIDWGLSNSEYIHNIALAGSYGSGKSSILKSFQEKNTYKYKFLPISLATFESSLEKGDKLMRLIELSILQQLLYHEKDKNIPDSRFKKIKISSKKVLFFKSIWILITIISVLYLWLPNWLSPLLSLKLPDELLKKIIEIPFNHLSIAVTLISALYVIYKSIQTLTDIEVRKLSINNTEIEIDNSVGKSILNHHIDEIMYFFEVTNYNVVIIEDLDRFDETNIFTKLREINLLLNNSKKIDRSIVFIYAIRDDVFKGENRTKFFDFVIPVIPVINSSNSKEKLKKIVDDNGYNITPQLIEDISYFIFDMRLLLNIMNEYGLYTRMLDTALNQDKLLSIIVYKNIFPDDFSKLNNNSGVLYETLNQKHKYLEEKVSELNNQRTEIENKIAEVENEKIKNINELRTIYISKIIEKIINNSSVSFKGFFINNAEISIKDAILDTNFSYIKNNLSTVQYIFNGGNRNQINFSFVDVENEVDEKSSYEKREEFVKIINEKSINVLSNKINELEIYKNNLQKTKIMDLVSNKSIKIKTDSEDTRHDDQEKLINLLLRSGYIDEDYIDYITIFYEGSISKTDHQFLMNVKTQTKYDFGHKIDKVENLIEKIGTHDFEKEYVLNFDILDYLLVSDKFVEKRNILLTQLSNASTLSFQFINKYTSHTSQIEKFIQLLSKYWEGIWSFIDSDSTLTGEKKNEYLKIIMQYADVEDIKKIFKNHIPLLANKGDFLSIITDTVKLKEIVKALDIRFAEISMPIPQEMIEFIYENSYYEVNVGIITFILKYKKMFNEDRFNTSNYTFIKETKLEKLIQVVESDINQYIESVYIRLKGVLDEKENYLLELLVSTSMSLDNKKRIIEKTKTLITDIRSLSQIEVINLLLESERLSAVKRVSAKWSNVVHIFQMSDNVFDENLVNFLNSKSNASELSKFIISEESLNTFVDALLRCESIDNDSYKLLLKSIPNNCSFSNISGLSEEKVFFLIEYNLLKTNKSNYSLLKNNYPNRDLHITLLAKDSTQVISNFAEYNFDIEDLKNILNTDLFDSTTKQYLIDNTSYEVFRDNNDLLATLGLLSLSIPSIKINVKLVESMFWIKELTASDKIELYNQFKDELKDLDLTNFIKALGSPFEQMTVNGKRPLIENTDSNKAFIENLIEIKYISKYSVEKNGLRISTYKRSKT